ncbi:MAG TPA: molybdopterin-dependent oxidoreductase [Propioniciclava tarda]|nr:molybdopterin-dependent oxidoreductase [Propioniciclava tarda]
MATTRADLDGASSTRPRTRAAASGVLAVASGLGVSHLVAGVVGPSSSPLVAVGSRAVDVVPGPLKEWAVSVFGTADKAVLIGVALVVTLGLGAVVGMIWQRSVRLGVVAGGLLALVALAAAALDPGRRLLWWLPALVAFGVAAWGLTRLSASTEVVDAASRRRFFRMGVGLGALGVAGWVLGEGVRSVVAAVPGVGRPRVTLPPRSSAPLPVGLEAEVPGLSAFVTPASEFFRIDTALAVPQVDAATWKLSVSGLVDRPFTLGWDELLAMDAIEKNVTLACVSNDVGGPLIGSARWLGVRTSELLARAGVQAGADMVLGRSVDGFTVSAPLAALLDGRGALVAYGMNGEALTAEHGYPARLLTPGLYGFVGATKWLIGLEVTTYASAQAYWTQRGWAAQAPMKAGSRIEVPRASSRVPVGVVKVGGAAWAPEVGVGRVQVRVDGGPWVDATLGPDAGVQFWRQWLYSWDAAAGDHRLQVRVVDLNGVAQDETMATPFPDGASGLHTVAVVVG